MSEVRMSEVRMSEVRMSEVRMSEVRMSEVLLLSTTDRASYMMIMGQTSLSSYT